MTDDWLEQMLIAAQHPQVGVVGALLLYPNGTIQHAGMAPTANGWVHLHRGERLEPRGEVNATDSVVTADAVTGACLLIRKRLFRQLGGFDERLPVTMNDVDLCLRVRRQGLLVAVACRARLLHFESLTRGWSREGEP